MTVDVNVRYFAAAADAAGRDGETLSLAAEATIGELRERLGDRHGAEMTRVLDLCSFLRNGQVADPGTSIGPGADGDATGPVRIDVLPPFAGG